MKYIVFVFGLMCTILGVFYVVSEFQLRDFREMYRPLGPYLGAKGNRLHYVDVKAAPPSAPTILFIHGASSNLNDHYNLFAFGTFGPALSKEARLVYVDRPGHGYSDVGTADTPELQAKRYIELLDSLGIDQVILLSHSMGSVSALTMAINYPSRVKSMLMIAPVGYPDPSHIQWFHRVATTPVIGSVFARTMVVPFRRTFLKNAMVDMFDPQIIARWFADRAGMQLELMPESFVNNAREVMRLSDETTNLSSRYKEIRQNVIIVTGDQDKIVQYSTQAVRLGKDILNSKTVVLPGLGHKPEYQERKPILKLIRQLIK